MTEQPRRVHYSAGMQPTVSDFEAEQNYHRQMRYLHNRLLHGHGTATGLDVSVDDSGIHVSPGFAIDALGREIVVSEQVCLPLPDRPGRERRWTRDVALAWREVPAEAVPTPEGTTATRWIEEPKLSLVSPDSVTSEQLVLARLTWKRRRSAIDIDTTVRRPLDRPMS